MIIIVITIVLCVGITLFFILKTKRIKRVYDEKIKEHKEQDTLSLVATKTDNYLMISDKDDRIEWINEGFTRLTGYTPEEVIGKNPPDVLRGEYTDTEAAERIDKKAKEKKPYSAEILNYNENGDPIWMFFNVTPLLNEQGEITRYITVGSDITERKKEEAELKKQKEQIEGKYKKIWETSLSVHKQKEEVEKLNTELNKQKEKLEQTYKQLSVKNSKLWRTSLLVNKHKEEVEKVRTQLATKNKDITDSIQYAKIIQQAILPRVSEIQKLLPEMFILHRPKDIVSGDFYWFHSSSTSVQKQSIEKSVSADSMEVQLSKKPQLQMLENTSSPHQEDTRLPNEQTRWPDVIIIAACDCTGHGVPGAFMSMIGNDLLNNAVLERGITEPAAILDRLQAGIRFTLQQDRADSEAQDGMDMALCTLIRQPTLGSEQTNSEVNLQFAGANNPLWIVRDSELIVVKGDKQPVGIYGKDIEPFTNHNIELQNGDTFYLFSDGYQDQFGGDKGKKFKSKQFKELLLSIQDQSMQEQKIIIDKSFLNWKGKQDQVDDILVIGIRV